jgi:acetyltransferase-like isoleucine patch superfamily enzyme
MDRAATLQGTDVETLYAELCALHDRLDAAFGAQFARSLPFAEALFDRWERARTLGFGEGSSIYDSALVFGRPTVGRDVWIGPNTVIDGSGGLEIGDRCTLAVGVHIYTHDNVAQTLTGGSAPIERSPVRIGARTYVGPNAIVARGVDIGEQCVIAAGSFVNRAVPDRTIVGGTPARPIGRVRVDGAQVAFEYGTFGQGAGE